MATTAKIMSEVLALPFADRSYLARKLLESLDESESLTDEEKMILDRRSLERKEGAVESLSLEELKREVQSRLK